MNVMEKLSKLFKPRNDGKVQFWEVEVDEGRYRTRHGIEGGKVTTANWTICQPKNVGKANETTAEEQAEREAKALHTQKLEKGYTESMEEASKGEKLIFTPMLAKNYKDREKHLNFDSQTYCVQPKLDGIRCVVNKDGMFSRNGKTFTSCPHIFDKLKPVFDKYPDFIFDGELYADKFKNDFNKICKLAKRTNLKPEDLEATKENLQYWLYDCCTEDASMGFSSRFGLLKQIILAFNLIEDDSPIKLTETKTIKDKQEVDTYFDQFISEGYEGLMFRDSQSAYEQKRSNGLLKKKEFQTDEYEIISVEEGVGNRAGTAGYMWLTNGKDKFKSNIKGNFEWLSELLKNKDVVVGRMATVRYANLTPDGIPRFGFVIGIRDYE